MNSGKLAVLGIMLVLSAPAMGDILNGDLSSVVGDQPADWQPALTDGNASQSVVDNYAPAAGDNVLKLSVVNDDVDDESSVTATPTILQESGYYVPVGTDRLIFDAGVEAVGPAGESWPWPDVTVAVTYFDVNTGTVTSNDPFSIGSSEAAWSSRTILLPDLDPQELVYMTIVVESIYAPPAGETLTADAYFDDLQFVPEPATLCVLAIGGLGLLRRRR